MTHLMSSALCERQYDDVGNEAGTGGGRSQQLTHLHCGVHVGCQALQLQHRCRRLYLPCPQLWHERHLAVSLMDSLSRRQTGRLLLCQAEVPPHSTM